MARLKTATDKICNLQKVFRKIWIYGEFWGDKVHV